MKSLVEYMTGVENKKRSLEESVDKLNEEIAQIKAGSTITAEAFSAEEKADQVSRSKLIFKIFCYFVLFFKGKGCFGISLESEGADFKSSRHLSSTDIEAA